MKSAWHRHVDVRCAACGVVVYPTAVCIRRGKPEKCPIPKIVRCRACVVKPMQPQ